MSPVVVLPQPGPNFQRRTDFPENFGLGGPIFHRKFWSGGPKFSGPKFRWQCNLCSGRGLGVHTALRVTDTMAYPSRFVRSLHKMRDSIFKLSIPSASWWYVTSVSATFVPPEDQAWIGENFYWRHYTALLFTVTLAGPSRIVHSLHRMRTLIFKFSILSSSWWYFTSVSATFVPAEG